MLKYIIVLCVCLFALTPMASATFPIPEYEIVVVETTPLSVQLDMTLKQISEAKEASALHDRKKHVTEVITQHVSPLLSDSDFTDGYNLIQLAGKIPASKILSELIGAERSRGNVEASDFMVIFLPKKPQEVSRNAVLPYAHLYSSNKAAVIDSRPVGLPEGGYLTSINLRVSEAMSFLYNRNFVELESKDPFFVGALFHLHLDGPQSYFKVQLAGSLPSNIEFPFSQIEEQAEFTAIRLPRSPESKYYYDHFHGAIVEFIFAPQSQEVAMLTLKFGELGSITPQGWDVVDSLDAMESQAEEWNGEFGVRSFFHRFNVPHLFGNIREASGFGPLDASLAFLYNIQVNIHKVELNMQSMKITGMRTTVELPVKESNWFTALIEPGLRWPTAEVPSITQKVIDGGNQQIEPYREQLQGYIDMGGDIIDDPDVQSQIFSLMLTIFENQGGVQP